MQVAPSSVANTVQVAPSIVAEDGPQKLTYTFTATGPLTRNITVAYEIGGSATAGSDFTGIPMGASTESITIPANSSAPGSAATLTITPTPDTLIEPDETVVITLKNGTGYGLGTDRVATGTIVNDDFRVNLILDGLPEETAPEPNELAPGAILPIGSHVSLIADVPAGRTATLAIAQGSDKVRVYSATGDVVLEKGREHTLIVGGTPQTYYSVEAIAPSTSPGNVRFTLMLTGGMAPPASDTVVATAVTAINIAATDEEADEVRTARDHPNTGRFRLSRSGDTSQDLVVEVQVTGTATYSVLATDDYALDLVGTGLTGSFVTIPSGQAFVDVVVTPFQDAGNEDAETVILSIQEYTGYAVGPRARATVSILDAPDISGARIAYRIDLDARPATRCWPVDGAMRMLPNQPQDTLRTGEPYVFSLSAEGTERTAGVTWELSHDIRTEEGTVRRSLGSASGDFFPQTFVVAQERLSEGGAVMYDTWYVHFFIDANRNGRRDAAESFTVGRFNDVLQDRKAIWLCRLEEEKKPMPERSTMRFSESPPFLTNSLRR